VLFELQETNFSGHETFSFRWRWLKKGVEAVREDPAIFNAEDAIVALGVGRNMVRSIRHWCLATGVLEEPSEAEHLPRGSLVISDLGARLLLDEGWDPYLDDAASLWLLQWQLAAHPNRATTWFLAFTAFGEAEFSRDRLVDFIELHASETSARATRASLARDVDCFLKTYAPAPRSSSTLLEDALDCPLVELGLIEPVGSPNQYRFVIGPKMSLPTAVFGFAMMSHLGAHLSDRATVAVDECLYGPGSPGQAFKLDENSLVMLVEELSQLTDGAVGFSDTAGARRIYLRPGLSPFDLLDLYYGGSSASGS